MATALRDAVWGDITLGARELALIDTEAFQRLRMVRQLGFTDLVFPGAHHTRFEHSLGVYHLSGLLLDRLATLPEPPPVSREQADAFRAAALLHDIGHYPFSHAVEELESHHIRRHESIARDVICDGEVAEVLAGRWDVDPALVAWLVAGPPAAADTSPAATLLREALDSGLDIDKLDYLVRDARAANVPYGMVDVQRLLGSLAVVDREDGMHLAVDVKGVAALQSLVFAKHLMFATVYWHHACRAAVAMLLRAVQAALDAGTLNATGLSRAHDASLLTALTASGSPRLARQLAGRLIKRRLYKRVAEVRVDDPRFPKLEQLWFDPHERAATEDAWAAQAGGRSGDILLDIPEPRHIIVDIPVVVDGVAVSYNEVSGVVETDLHRFQRWARRIRVFAASRELAGVASALIDDMHGPHA